jgi:hypothetical protein
MMTTSFAYQNPARHSISAEQPASTATETGDPDLGVFDLVVGPDFRSGAKTLAPLVTITDDPLDLNRIPMVAQAVADEY